MNPERVYTVLVEPHFTEDDFWHAIARLNQFEYSLKV